MTARRSRRARHAPNRWARGWAWLREGERVWVLAAGGLAVLLAAMAIGPVQSYAAAADRVDQLAQSRAELQSEVDRLEERRLRLQDPEEIELLAREQFGLVRPGEIPYIVSKPEPEFDRVRTNPPEPRLPGPWHRRLREALRELHG